MTYFLPGSTVWYADDPCPKCGREVVTDGKKKACTGCGWHEEDT